MYYWTARKRLGKLEELLALYDQFCHARQGGEVDKAWNLRKEINLIVPQAEEALFSVGLGMISIGSPIAGSKGPYPVLRYLFVEVFASFVAPAEVVDMLNQAIGVYRSILGQEFLHIFNPLWWLKELIQFLVRLPFYLLGISGFNQKALEMSAIGRAVKLALGALVVVTTLTTLLKNLGMLDGILARLGS